jgi:hypothetical protein
MKSIASSSKDCSQTHEPAEPAPEPAMNELSDKGVMVADEVKSIVSPTPIAQ